MVLVVIGVALHLASTLSDPDLLQANVITARPAPIPLRAGVSLHYEHAADGAATRRFETRVDILSVNVNTVLFRWERELETIQRGHVITHDTGACVGLAMGWPEQPGQSTLGVERRCQLWLSRHTMHDLRTRRRAHITRAAMQRLGEFQADPSLPADGYILQVEGSPMYKLKLDGVWVEVPALEVSLIERPQVRLWVLDDPQHPLLLRTEDLMGQQVELTEVFVQAAPPIDDRQAW